MKLILALIFVVGISFFVYLFFIHIKKINWKVFAVSSMFGLILFSLFIIAAYKASKMPDTWCSIIRNTSSYPPAETKTAMDYFEAGNYEYDRGNCKQAITDFTKSISLNSKYPQSLNNRAYTYMRMGNYKDALTDLNKALTIDPNYINALMNRGDIYNYYLIDKNLAIADYKKIIELGATGTSVCGHLYLAQHDGWNLGTIFFGFPTMVIQCSK